MSAYLTHPLYNSRFPVLALNGRPCQIGKAVRVRAANHAWGWQTIHSVTYLDDQQPPIEVWYAAKLNRALAKSPLLA